MARPQPILVALLVLIVLVLGGAWFVTTRLAGEATPETARSDADPFSTEVRVTTAEAERETIVPPAEFDDVDSTESTVAWPVKLDLRLLEANHWPSEEGVRPLGSDANATLQGSIRHGEKGLDGKVVFIAGPNEGREIETADGEFGATDLRPGLNVVRIVSPGQRGALRQVRLRPNLATDLHVNFVMPSSVWVTVHDDQGEPLEGAEVRMDGQLAVTDVDGDAYLPAVTPGLNELVEVSKDGFATYGGQIGVTLGYPIPKGKVQYRLAKACRLDVTLAGSVGGKGDALVVVMPDNPLAAADGQRGLGGYPIDSKNYPWYKISPKRLRPGGSITFDDLPPRRVAVRVFHEGAEADPPVSIVDLRPDRPRAVSVEMKPAARLHGRVTADGSPVADAKVVLEAPDRTAATLQYFAEAPYFLEAVPLPALPVAYQEVRSDSNGEFVLSSWPQYARSRYLHATSPDGRLFAARVVRAGNEEAQRVELDLEPIEIGRGRLEIDFPNRFQGLPVELRVNGRPETQATLPASRALILEEITEGRWTLEASWNGRPILEPRTFELLGDTRQVIELPEGAILGQDPETVKRARGAF